MPTSVVINLSSPLPVACGHAALLFRTTIFGWAPSDAKCGRQPLSNGENDVVGATGLCGVGHRSFFMEKLNRLGDPLVHTPQMSYTPGTKLSHTDATRHATVLTGDNVMVTAGLGYGQMMKLADWLILADGARIQEEFIPLPKEGAAHSASGAEFIPVPKEGVVAPLPAASVASIPAPPAAHGLHYARAKLYNNFAEMGSGSDFKLVVKYRGREITL